MPTGDGSWATDLIGVLLVLVLVAANGFFVAAEFSLVAVRRSRVAQLVAAGRRNAQALQRAVDNLDSYLAATQLGITISSLALGWIGEPALAHLIEPLLAGLPGWLAATGLACDRRGGGFHHHHRAAYRSWRARAEKSRAPAQRRHGTARRETAAAVPVSASARNRRAQRSRQCRAAALRSAAGTVEESLHSPEELKWIVSASQEGGLLHEAQQELVERILNIGDRRISDIMTPRVDVEWIDADDSEAETLRSIREAPHEQLLVGKGSIDEPIGMVLKGACSISFWMEGALDPLAVVREPLVVHEAMTIFKVLEQFKKAPVRLATIVDEYGGLEGIVTQTDLLEAIAGNLPDVVGEEPEAIEREDGSFLIDGMMSAQDAFDRLGIPPAEGGFHTIAGFVLSQLGHLPVVGEHFDYEGWRFEVVDLDGSRIDKVMADTSACTGWR